jgi:predicted metal-dependent peptidase
MPAVQVFEKSPVAGDSGIWPKLKLSHQHDALWGETKGAMLWAVPCYADIWLSLMIDRDHEQAWFTDCISTCATDDKILYVNPEWYFKLTLDERLFVACHEIAHAMFNHAGVSYALSKEGKIVYSDGVTLPYDSNLMNSAMDYVINDQLVTAKIGKLPAKGLHWPSFISGNESVLDAYRKLYEVFKNNNGASKPGDENRTSEGGRTQGPGSGESFDKILKPGEGRGKTPSKAISERSQTEWDTTITAAMESAKLRGQLPDNLARIFTARLKPQADWRELYQMAVTRRLGNDRYTWSTLDPQLIYRGIGSPGRTVYGCNLLAIAVDTSGSITQKTLDVFLAETTELIEQARPKRIVFIQCDASVKEYDEVDGGDDLYGRKLKGGGGTAFAPVMERIEQEGDEPDMMIYFTDLYGSFPDKAPDYPVVWAVVDNKTPDPPPFGELVIIPPQHNSAE